MKSRNSFAAIAAATALAACTQQPAARPEQSTLSSGVQTVMGSEDVNRNQSWPRPDQPPQNAIELDFMAFIQDADQWRGAPHAQQVDNVSAGTGDKHSTPNPRGDFTDLYMRMMVLGAKPGGDGHTGNHQLRSYSQEKRSLIGKLLFGEKLSATLTAKVRIERLDLGSNNSVDIVIPLATLTHDSSSSVGEVWDTQIWKSAIPAPFFRVGPATVISITKQYDHSETVTSDVVSASLRVALEAAKLTAPGGSVVTTLSKSAVNRQAQIFDTAIGHLLSNTITEHLTSDEPVSNWRPDTWISVTLTSPSLSFGNLDPAGKVGTWYIGLSRPRPSIFSEVEFDPCGDDACMSKRREALKTAYATVRPEQILKFQAADNVTLADHLQGQTWFIEAVGNIKNKDKDKDASRQFCNRIVTTLYELGLNHTDSLVGLWAVASAMPLSSDTVSVMNEGCASQVSELNAALGLEWPNGTH